MIDYILFALWKWKRNRRVKKRRKNNDLPADYISYCEKDAALTLEMYARTRDDRWER